MDKPECQLSGRDGNVFNIIGIVCRTLRLAGQPDKAIEFSTKAFAAKSYNEVLILCEEYVDVG